MIFPLSPDHLDSLDQWESEECPDLKVSKVQLDSAASLEKLVFLEHPAKTELPVNVDLKATEGNAELQEFVDPPVHLVIPDPLDQLDLNRLDRPSLDHQDHLATLASPVYPARPVNAVNGANAVTAESADCVEKKVTVDRLVCLVTTVDEVSQVHLVCRVQLARKAIKESPECPVVRDRLVWSACPVLTDFQDPKVFRGRVVTRVTLVLKVRQVRPVNQAKLVHQVCPDLRAAVVSLVPVESAVNRVLQDPLVQLVSPV